MAGSKAPASSSSDEENFLDDSDSGGEKEGKEPAGASEPASEVSPVTNKCATPGCTHEANKGHTTCCERCTFTGDVADEANPKHPVQLITRRMP